MSRNTIRCYQCGASLAALSLPLSRRDMCPQCAVHLHACRQCAAYDVNALGQCLEEEAEAVNDKAKVNFCEWFRPNPNALTPTRAASRCARRTRSPDCSVMPATRLLEARAAHLLRLRKRPKTCSSNGAARLERLMRAQNVIGLVFALGVGLAVAWVAYDRITDPGRGVQRQEEEQMVLAARQRLTRSLALLPGADVVDPLAPNRVAGKVYIYPSEGVWEVSGYYRRDAQGAWMPWLMRLDPERMISLKVSADDPAAREAAATDPLISLQ